MGRKHEVVLGRAYRAHRVSLQLCSIRSIDHDQGRIMLTMNRIELHLDAYAVVADTEEVITVGHRTHSVNHH